MTSTQRPLAHKLRSYVALTRLNRPVGIWLLLWPTLWALWIACEGHPGWKRLVVFILGVVLMRSAGCVINDYWDRHWDGAVERTANRPLVTGQVSPQEALLLFAVLCLAAASLLLLLPLFSAALAIPAVLITMLYPTLKRHTHFPQFMLGISFSWGILMVFAAQSGHLPAMAWLLFLINCFWALAYDTMYAMVDRQDDLKVGVRSLAIFLGNREIYFIATMHASMFIFLSLLGHWLHYATTYYGGLIAAGCVMLAQQYLIGDRNRQACLRAFLISPWVGFFIFLGILAK